MVLYEAAFSLSDGFLVPAAPLSRLDNGNNGVRPVSLAPVKPDAPPHAMKNGRKKARTRSRSRRCSVSCPICILRYDPTLLLGSTYKHILPRLFPPSKPASAIPSASSPSSPPVLRRQLPPTRLDPSSIYTLIFLQSPQTYSYALYFTRSLSWKRGILCRGTLDHPSSPDEVVYHQRKADLSNLAPYLLACVKIGTLDPAVSGRKMLLHLSTIHIPAEDLWKAGEKGRWTLWWRRAVRVMWERGYADCEAGMEEKMEEKGEEEMREIGQEVERDRDRTGNEEVNVCDSTYFL